MFSISEFGPLQKLRACATGFTAAEEMGLSQTGDRAAKYEGTYFAGS